MLLLTAPRPIFASGLATALGAPVIAGPTGPTRLRIGGGATRTDAEPLLRKLAPVVVEVVDDPSVEGMVLDAGSVARVAIPVRVLVPAAWRTARMLGQLPVETGCVHLETTSGSARSTPAAHLLIAIVGQPDWTCGQDSQGLRLKGGLSGCRALLPPITVRVHAQTHGETEHARALTSLRREGWDIERVRSRRPPRTVDLAVPADLHPSAGRGLLRALAEHLPSIDPSALRMHAESAVDLHLPPRVTERPRATTVERVTLRTDDAAAAHTYAHAISALGIGEVRVHVGLGFDGGFRLKHHVRLTGLGRVRDLTAILQSAIDAVGVADRHMPNVYRADERDLEGHVEIDLPLRAAADGSLMANLLAGLRGYHVQVGNMTRPRELLERLEPGLTHGGGAPRMSEIATRQDMPRIAIGAAPMEIGLHVARLVEEHTGVKLDVARTFTATDEDIWIVMPTGARLRTQVHGVAHAPVRHEARPFLEVTPTRVRIGDHVLPRQEGHPLAPALERFAHTCVDGSTARLLDHLATSLRLNEPVLLEGPTAAGKTSAVLYLAALLGQPVVRLNLGGQTDTGELLGRYAPTPSGWTWNDGIVPRAMREGWWVVLDEINLAEPAVIERLNPVLERTPSLVLTEGDGTRFGPGGVPVAAGFHVFATMNPSDGTYGGRSALSPALRDRFGGQMMCDHATERDLLDQLRCMVHGDQPSVTCGGATWVSRSGGDASHAALAQPGIDEILATLARFHANVDAATRAEDDAQRIGAARREGMVVSRRTLLSLLDFAVLRRADVGLRRAFEEGIERYYVRRGPSPADAEAIRTLAAAAGMHQALGTAA